MSVPKWLQARFDAINSERPSSMLAQPMVANAAPVVANTVTEVANQVANRHGQYADKDRRRAYMRDLMRRRRAAARASNR